MAFSRKTAKKIGIMKLKMRLAIQEKQGSVNRLKTKKRLEAMIEKGK